MIQVAGSVSNLSLATSAASVSSLLANIYPTFKFLKITLQVSHIVLISFKFSFFQPSFQGQHIPPSPLPKLKFLFFYFFFKNSCRVSTVFSSLKFKLLLWIWWHRAEGGICGMFLPEQLLLPGQTAALLSSGSFCPGSSSPAPPCLSLWLSPGLPFICSCVTWLSLHE